MIGFADDIMSSTSLLPKSGWDGSRTRSLKETLPIMIEALKTDPDHWYKINGLK